MKKYSVLLAFLFCAFGAFSQEGEKVVKQPLGLSHELGLETGNLVGRLLGNEGGSGEELPDDPYLLTYKISTGKWALRTGLGGDWSKTVEREDGFADSRTVESSRFDVRLGVERRFSLGGKWLGNVALDGIGIFSQDKTIDDSGFDVITNSETVDGWGAGPSFGIQFNVTERLSFYTEGFVYYTSTERQIARTFKNFPEFDDELSSVDGERLKISLPSVLYLVLRF